MTDQFIQSVRDDWRAQPVATGKTLQQLRRKRWVPHLVLALEMLGGAAALLVGLWFAWVAVHIEANKLLFALSAATMLAAAPAICIATFMVRRDSLQWDDSSAESLLRTGARRAELSLRALRLGRLHVSIIVVFVAILWIAETLEQVDARGFLIFYTCLCVAFTVAYLAWSERQKRKLTDERAACLQLISALNIDGE